MRHVLPLIFAFALVSGCASAPRRAPDSSELASQGTPEERAAAFGPAAVGSDPGNLEVVDPVAPKGGDNFPTAALAAQSVGGAPERPSALHPGFLIRLGHQEDRDLNGTYRINFDGRIELPYNVVIHADGLTMEEFRQKVIEAYKPFFKSSTRLTVELVEKSYFVELRGLIAKPGKYRVRADTSLDEVIALGGGFPGANNQNSAETQPHFIKISRGEVSRMVNLEDYYKTGSLKVTTAWHGGEVLFFQKESLSGSDPNSLEVGTQVQVLGELKRPGEFGHRAGADVYFYMAEAGGPTRDTDFDRVQIYRGIPGKRVMMEFKLEEPETVPPVKPGDILVFQADKPTRFQKNVTTAANIASVLTAIALLIIAL
ncbi:MAG: polysaccharide biosynthesis/export family protein [Bdellovibrionota bacterium]